MSSLLKVQGLHYSFPDSPPILRGVSFQLNQGDFTLLAGRNGCGKTLLMRHLNGLVRLQQGELLFQGIPVHRNRRIREQIGLVFQNADSQFVAPTVEREIAFGPSNLRWEKDRIKESTRQYIDLLGLHSFEDRNPHTLSGGEKRRVAIASVMVMEPELIVLDEPFTGLDLEGVEQVLRSLLLLHRRGMSILLITHDLEKCLAHTDRVLIMDKGKIADQGTPEEILPRLNQWSIYSPWAKDRPLCSYSWLRETSR